MWDRVIGQERVKKTLLAALRTERLPHAYLFTGNEGVGKDAVALELARVLHCEKRGEEPCNTCASCLKMNSLQHPDVRLIAPLPVGKNEDKESGPLEKLTAAEIEVIQEQYKLKASNPYYRVQIPRASVIKINSIRELRRESAMSSLYQGKKVFIISHADEMGDEAANTLLKTLEEPPGDTLLILTTARPETLLQTIISRCQLVRFDPLREDEIAQALQARESVPEEQATLVARLANGSYSQALDLLQADLSALRQQVVQFVRLVLGKSAIDLMQEVEKLSSSKDRDLIVRFLTLMMMWFRDAYVLLNGGSIINLDQADDLQRFTKNFPHADLSTVMADVDRSISLIYKNAYIPLTLMQLAVRMKRAIRNT